MPKIDVEVGDQPIDLALCFQSGQLFRFRQVEDRCWEGVEGDYWYRISGTQLLRVETNGNELTVRRLFGLDENVAETHEALRNSGPEMASLIGQFGGLRLMRYSCPTEALFTFLCTANNNLPRITQMVSKLSQLGTPMPDSPFPAHRFPTTRQVAALSEEHLRDHGFGYRAKTIIAIATILDSDWFVGLKDLDVESAERALSSLPGIGPKLASCIALYGLGFTDAVPVDTHMWQAYRRTYQPAAKTLTPARHLEVARFLRERFGVNAGFAQLLLYFGNMRQ